MSGQPKLLFENIEELIRYGREWQKRLFLDDWVIKFVLQPYDEETENHGLCKYQFSHKRALITIYNNIPIDDYIEKLCDEKTLIHELLHCKFLSLDNGSYEGKVVDEHQHRLVEEMAKSLLMAKYNIGFDWFTPEEN